MLIIIISLYYERLIWSIRSHTHCHIRWYNYWGGAMNIGFIIFMAIWFDWFARFMPIMFIWFVWFIIAMFWFIILPCIWVAWPTIASFMAMPCAIIGFIISAAWAVIWFAWPMACCAIPMPCCI